MKRLALILSAAAVALSAAAAPAAASDGPVRLTPVDRLPFPERGYLVDVGHDTALGSGDVKVTENGETVPGVAFSPLNASGLRSAVVLAVDASDSMAGAPAAAAIEAAREFTARRGANEQVGVVAFNGGVRVLQPPTSSTRALQTALAKAPPLAYGTRIFDAVDRSLALLRQTRVSTGSIVVLSDGADVGSHEQLQQAIAKARRQHVRVFTVGLRSSAFEASPLSRLAAQTGGSFVEATSAAQLTGIYRALSSRLASEFVLQYRSDAAPESHVRVRVTIAGGGTAGIEYTAPTPSKLPPFHRSLLTRFLLSPASLAVLAMLVAGLLAYALGASLEARRSRLVERLKAFGTPAAQATRASRSRVRRAAGYQRASGWLAALERRLDIADIQHSAATVAGATAAGTLLAAALLGMLAPPAALLAFLVPFGVHSLIGRKVRRVRDEFNEQLPTNLQVLAAALRTGHSFAGALAVAVENAEEPSRRELRRALADEQLGLPMDEALRQVAERMASRDVDQVALVAELQRTTGGNVAEVLDTVVETIRDRQDVRRLAHTLTAQGRMARWIMTALPIVTGLGFFLIQPEVAKPMLVSTVGQVAFVFAALMVCSGSVVIQRIIDIEV